MKKLAGVLLLALLLPACGDFSGSSGGGGASDLGESTNVAAANPSIVAAMQADLDAWKAQLVPPLW